MDFINFNSLKNTYMTNYIERMFRSNYDGKWIVTEKLHGANFQFRIYRNGEFKLGSREQYVDDNFFNAGSIIKPTLNAIIDKSKYIFDNNATIDSFIIYGELTGPNIAKKHPIYYGDNYQFHAFEIKLVFADNEFTILSYGEFVDTIDYIGIPKVPLITITSSLKDALKINETFVSALTPIEYTKQNIAEGITITSFDPVFSGQTRLYAKKKTDKFNEKIKIKKIKTTHNLSENGIKFFNLIEEHLTDERIDSVVSKIGDVNFNDHGKIVGMYLKDVYQDVEEWLNFQQSSDKTFKEHIKDSIKDEWKTINAVIMKKVQDKITDYLK